MKKVLSVSFGELVLKGNNRRIFVDRAIKKIKKAIRNFKTDRLYLEGGKFFIEADESLYEEMIKEIQKVFGIVYISLCLRCEKNLEAIGQAAISHMKAYEDKNITFKVEANRTDKSFEPKSPELVALVGGRLLDVYDNLKVDVHKPQLMVYIDIKEQAYVYTERFRGQGGLPIGSSGRGLSLLSGGIDSPVATFMMAKRGVEVHALHFHSYPFTSDRAFEKVKALAQILADYVGDFTMYSVNLLPIQKEINEKCRDREMTVLSRRFMMRIADRLAKRDDYSMIITGESLGQVASQTIEGLTATNSVTDLPILRPLIGMDKTEIIEIAEKIGSYETSILPFEDCCTVFLPPRPVTKPRISDLEKSEANLDVERLVDQAIENMEIIKVIDED